jgi:hypothetical protein
MTPSEFTDVLERRIELTRKVLDSKAKEYAPGDDRLHNFHAAGGLKGESPAQAAWGMMVKHIVSVADMVRQPQSHSQAVWDEKIGDLVNYAVLIEACVTEERGQQINAAIMKQSAHTPPEPTGMRPTEATR